MTTRRFDDDAALVLAARAGDGEAFTTLFRRWFDPCVEVAQRIVHDQETAAEVAQETFLVAWRQIDTLRDPSAFGGWVLRTSRNKALNRLERERRSVAVDQDEHPVLSRMEAVDDVAGEVSATDQQRLVWAASAALGERDVSVLDLHLRHGLDVGEIAEALDITPNNAHQVVFRMKGKLAGAIRAWVLFKGGDPSCDELRSALRLASATSFSAATVKVIDRHVKGCDDCARRQAAILAPEAMFAAVPVLPVAGFLRERAASSLRDGGVPLGPDAAVPTSDGSSGTQPEPAGGPEADAVELASATAPPTSTVASARKGPSRSLAAALVVAVVLLVVGAVVALRGGDGGVAVSDEELVAVAPATAPPSVLPLPETPAVSEPTATSTRAPATTTPTTVASTTTSSSAPAAPPTVISFVAAPASTPGGQCPVGQWASTLTWRTTGADSVVATAPAGVAPVAGGPFGTAVGCALTPGTTWTLTASGPGGTATATA